MLYCILILYGANEPVVEGPFPSQDVRDRRALELHDDLDSLDLMYWFNCGERGEKPTFGSYPEMFFDQEEVAHDR